MRTRSQRLGGLLAIALASVLVGACGSSGGPTMQQSSPGFAACDEKPNECNSGPTKPGGSITVVLEKKIQNWNVFDVAGHQFETTQIMNALVPEPFVLQPSNTVLWNKNLLAEEPKVISPNPQTVQYKIRKEAVWSDGIPISAKDFQFYWKANNGTSCPECTPALTTGYDQIKAVEGSDGDKTVTVTFNNGAIYPDWKGLFNLVPSHLAAGQGDLNTPAGLAKAFEYFKGTPTWSGGPYKIQEYAKDATVTLVQNEKWYGPKPSLDKITFRIMEDQAQQIPALQNKDVQMLISQPNADMVAKVGGMAGVNYHLAAGLTWENLEFNTKNAALADVELRKAIFTAVNRKEIIEKTIGGYFKKSAPLNNYYFMPGAPGYKDLITPTGQGAGNVDAATKVLTDAGYRIDGGKLIGKTGQPVPTFRLRHTVGNQLRQQAGELFQKQMEAIGIAVKIEPTANLTTTLATGDFDIALFAWVSSPFNADSKSLWSTAGPQNYGKWSNAEVDKCLDEAAKVLDETKTRDLLNRAGEIMAKEAYVLPLFQRPAFVAVYSDYINIRNNATESGQTYNIGDWGLKADSVK